MVASFVTVVWGGSFVLVELGLVEQRYQVVFEVINNASTVTDVAVRFGVTRQTVHRTTPVSRRRC